MQVLEPEVGLDGTIEGQKHVFTPTSFTLTQTCSYKHYLTDPSKEPIICNAITNARLPAIQSILSETEIHNSVLRHYFMTAVLNEKE